MSAFTALNGGSPKASEPPTITVEKPSASEERPSSSSAAQPHPAPEVSTNQNQKEAWTPSDRPASFKSAPYPDLESSHKRKRSDSIEARREATTQERTPETATAPTHAEAHEAYVTPSREYRHFREDQREKEPWYTSQNREERNHYESQQNSATSTQGQSEEQIAEALRRATEMDHGDYSNTSPETEERSSMSLYGGYDHRGDPILQHDPKKRKRNFSNRTKTGCLTCRKRKKKCDEQKPECEFVLISICHFE